MVCQQCGSPVEGTFCSRCGVKVQAPPAASPNPGPAPPYGVPPPGFYEPRVHRHVHTLGILWCVYGAYRAVAGIFGGLFLMGLSRSGFFTNWGGFGPHGGMPPFFGAPWMAGLGSYIAVMSLVMAALAFLVGFSLMNRKPWGRTLAIVAAILSLIKIPLGTAIGIYTLWVLAPAASGAEYDAIADRT